MPENSTRRTYRRLRNLTVNRVDFVDDPANPHARITLYKRADAPDFTANSPAPAPTEKVGRKLSRESLERIMAALESLSELVGEPAESAKSLVGNSPDAQSGPVPSARKTKEEESMDSLRTLKDQLGSLAEAEDLTAALGDIAKCLDSVATDFEAAIAAAKEEGKTEATAAIAALADENVESEADIAKRADLPEDVRKRFEDLERIAKDAEAKVAKMESERRVAEFTKRAEDFAHVAPAAELGPVLATLSDALEAEVYAKVEGWLSSANARLDTADIYKEVGRTIAPSAGSPEALIEEKAKALMAADASLSIEQARVEVVNRNPELYATYRMSSLTK